MLRLLPATLRGRLTSAPYYLSYAQVIANAMSCIVGLTRSREGLLLATPLELFYPSAQARLPTSSSSAKHFNV